MAQHRISKIQSLTIREELVELFKALPMTRSAAIAQSILKASKRPDLLHMALRHRMSEPKSGNNVRVSYTREPRLDAMIDTLAEMTDLSGEQVIRLCMEAYIHRL